MSSDDDNASVTSDVSTVMAFPVKKAYVPHGKAAEKLIMEAYLTKSPGNFKSVEQGSSHKWRRRFFEFRAGTPRMLHYYKDHNKKESEQKGVIEIGPQCTVSVIKSQKYGLKDSPYSLLVLHTPSRDFFLCADNFEEHKAWLNALGKSDEIEIASGYLVRKVPKTVRTSWTPRYFYVTSSIGGGKLDVYDLVDGKKNTDSKETYGLYGETAGHMKISPEQDWMRAAYPKVLKQPNWHPTTNGGNPVKIYPENRGRVSLSATANKAEDVQFICSSPMQAQVLCLLINAADVSTPIRAVPAIVDALVAMCSDQYQTADSLNRNLMIPSNVVCDLILGCFDRCPESAVSLCTRRPDQTGLHSLVKLLALKPVDHVNNFREFVPIRTEALASSIFKLLNWVLRRSQNCTDATEQLALRNHIRSVVLPAVTELCLLVTSQGDAFEGFCGSHLVDLFNFLKSLSADKDIVECFSTTPGDDLCQMIKLADTETTVDNLRKRYSDILRTIYNVVGDVVAAAEDNLIVRTFLNTKLIPAFSAILCATVREPKKKIIYGRLGKKEMHQTKTVTHQGSKTVTKVISTYTDTNTAFDNHKDAYKLLLKMMKTTASHKEGLKCVGDLLDLLHLKDAPERPASLPATILDITHQTMVYANGISDPDKKTIMLTSVRDNILPALMKLGLAMCKKLPEQYGFVVLKNDITGLFQQIAQCAEHDGSWFTQPQIAADFCEMLKIVPSLRIHDNSWTDEENTRGQAVRDTYTEVLHGLLATLYHIGNSATNDTAVCNTLNKQILPQFEAFLIQTVSSDQTILVSADNTKVALVLMNDSIHAMQYVASTSFKELHEHAYLVLDRLVKLENLHEVLLPIFARLCEAVYTGGEDGKYYYELEKFFLVTKTLGNICAKYVNAYKFMLTGEGGSSFCRIVRALNESYQHLANSPREEALDGHMFTTVVFNALGELLKNIPANGDADSVRLIETFVCKELVTEVITLCRTAVHYDEVNTLRILSMDPDLNGLLSRCEVFCAIFSVLEVLLTMPAVATYVCKHYIEDLVCFLEVLALVENVPDAAHNVNVDDRAKQKMMISVVRALKALSTQAAAPIYVFHHIVEEDMASQSNNGDVHMVKHVVTTELAQHAVSTMLKMARNDASTLWLVCYILDAFLEFEEAAVTVSKVKAIDNIPTVIRLLSNTRDFNKLSKQVWFLMNVISKLMTHSENSTVRFFLADQVVSELMQSIYEALKDAGASGKTSFDSLLVVLNTVKNMLSSSLMATTTVCSRNSTAVNMVFRVLARGAATTQQGDRDPDIAMQCCFMAAVIAALASHVGEDDGKIADVLHGCENSEETLLSILESFTDERDLELRRFAVHTLASMAMSSQGHAEQIVKFNGVCTLVKMLKLNDDVINGRAAVALSAVVDRIKDGPQRFYDEAGVTPLLRLLPRSTGFRRHGLIQLLVNTASNFQVANQLIEQGILDLLIASLQKFNGVRTTAAPVAYYELGLLHAFYKLSLHASLRERLYDSDLLKELEHVKENTPLEIKAAVEAQLSQRDGFDGATAEDYLKDPNLVKVVSSSMKDKLSEDAMRECKTLTADLRTHVSPATSISASGLQHNAKLSNQTTKLIPKDRKRILGQMLEDVILYLEKSNPLYRIDESATLTLLGQQPQKEFSTEYIKGVAIMQTRLINELIAVLPKMKNKHGEPTQSMRKPGDPINIMISYNWGTSKQRARKLADALNARRATHPDVIGHVWIDVDNMNDTLYNSMADALETSDVVLVMPSKLYEASCNCTLEIQYSQDLNKRILHCKVERGYSPRGRVGLILGGTKYYDFAQVDECENISEPQQKVFNTQFEQLFADLAKIAASPVDAPVSTELPLLSAQALSQQQQQHTSIDLSLTSEVGSVSGSTLTSQTDNVDVKIARLERILQNPNLSAEKRAKFEDMLEDLILNC